MELESRSCLLEVKIFSKILLDITTFTTEERYKVGTVGGNGKANIQKDEGNINRKHR